MNTAQRRALKFIQGQIEQQQVVIAKHVTDRLVRGVEPDDCLLEAYGRIWKWSEALANIVSVRRAKNGHEL